MKKIRVFLLAFMLFLLGGISVCATESNPLEDPQWGRENGYLADGFFDTHAVYAAKSGNYVHNDRFDGYTVKDVIDVSAHQYGINWTKVKQSGIDYAIIRAGFRGYGKTGSYNADAYFEKNIKEALAAGLEVGVYFFSQAISEKEAVAEAKYTLDLIKGYDVTLPVVMDFEYAADANGLVGRLYEAKLSKSKATKICKAFCSTVLDQGYTPMVYANKHMLENGLNASEIAKDYKIWLANYETQTTYTGDYEFWQYTQEGQVDGITTKVDKNFWYEAPKSDMVIKDIRMNIKDTLADRIYGKTRYETSFKIAEVLKEELGVKKFDNIIVASGKNFADALAGSYLASVKNAPIIMTNGKNAADVREYIKKNLKEDGTVYLLGGTAAVGQGMSCGLSDFNVKRLSGATRYETNIEILKEAKVNREDILVCTGKNFADSLSGSAANRPILLVSGKLSAVQKNFLSTLPGNDFYILGGEGAVSRKIEDEISIYGPTCRIGGATRFETSVMIAENFFESPKNLILAYSNNFPDGLCGGPLAMNMDAPLILTRTGKESAAMVYANENSIHKGAVLGGDILINDKTAGNVFGRLSELENQASAKFIEAGEMEYAVHYEVTIGNKKSADNYYYLMMADSYDGTLIGEPLAAVKKGYEISVDTNRLDRQELEELVMSKLVLAVKLSNGTYQAVNEPVAVSNPEMIAVNKEEIFKASSKKGVQGMTIADDGASVTDARYANTKQTLLNLDLSSVVGTEGQKGYVEYDYKGKTYYFSNCSALRSSIRTLNEGYEQYLYGNDDTTEVAVSLCLLLSYDEDTSYLIDPAARTKGKTYYLLNVQEKEARETLEALFLYLGCLFGQEDCYVTNWILGNEINASKAWNYGGNLSFDAYMQRYTLAYKMLYNAVKAQKSGNNVAISLDNGWMAVTDTYAGKKTLDTFAKKIHEENPNIQWSVAYHAYSYPLTRTDFWKDQTNTSDSLSTKYISMRNIDVLTDYAALLENTYGMPKDSIRVLLTEQGFSYSAGNPKLQAEAIARAYYTAEFNERIDTFIIRAIIDAQQEVKDGLYLGLMNAKTEKRIAFYVYEYMDSDLVKFEKTPAQGTVSSVNYSKFNDAKEILCETDWESVIPGFDASKLAAIK